MRLSAKAREALGGYLFILPNFLGFLAFTSLPILASLALSLYEWELFNPWREAPFVGLRNFVDLLGFHLQEAGRTPTATDWCILGSFFLLVALALVCTAACVWGFVRGRRRLGWDALGAFVVALVALVFLSQYTFRVWWPNDERFWYYAFNTVFLMAAIPLNIFCSLLLAMVLNRRLPGIYLYRLVFFLPTITLGVGIYILWRWMYNPDYGVINETIFRLTTGLKDRLPFLNVLLPESLKLPWYGPAWLASTMWAKPALMLMGFWASVGGYNCVLYLAALQGVPHELYEAAEIDGANAWQKFWSITWPMVAPTTFFVFVMAVIAGFQGGFDAAYVMTGGGPAGSTTTISYYIYNNAYVWYKMGYAAAIAWVLFVVILCITLLNWRFGGKVVHY